MRFAVGDRVVTRGESVSPNLRGEWGTVQEIDPERARPVVVEMDDPALPEDTNHQILSFHPRELIAR